MKDFFLTYAPAIIAGVVMTVSLAIGIVGNARGREVRKAEAKFTTPFSGESIAQMESRVYHSADVLADLVERQTETPVGGTTKAHPELSTESGTFRTLSDKVEKVVTGVRRITEDPPTP